MAAPTTFPASFKAYQYTCKGDPFDQVALNSSVRQSQLSTNHVRVRIHSAATNPVDLKIVAGTSGTPSPTPSTEHPAHYGFDLAGTIVEVGSDVPNSLGLRVNDEVYAMTEFEYTGAFAEFIAMDASLVAHKPKNVSFDVAAAIPLAAQTSLQALVNQGKLEAGQRVLILGGSGGTGTFAVQIAKALGAFVISTSSTRNVDLLKQLGADQVIDYTKEKWVDVLAPHSVDLIYDCGKEPNSWNSDAQVVLKEGTGRFVTILGIKDRIESPIGASATSFLVAPSRKDLIKIASFVEKGKVVPVIDSVHSFESLFDALTVQASGRARGKVVLKVAGSTTP